MALKGASPESRGQAAPLTAWPLDGDLRELAGRWGIDPGRDLTAA
jgi:hypothetical protein